jgi:hypothetical protein
MSVIQDICYDLRVLVPKLTGDSGHIQSAPAKSLDLRDVRMEGIRAGRSPVGHIAALEDMYLVFLILAFGDVLKIGQPRIIAHAVFVIGVQGARAHESQQHKPMHPALGADGIAIEIDRQIAMNKVRSQHSRRSTFDTSDSSDLTEIADFVVPFEPWDSFPDFHGETLFLCTQCTGGYVGQ